MSKTNLILFTILSFLFISCNNAGGSDNKSESTRTSSSTSIKKFENPCELVTLDDLRSQFSIEKEMEVLVNNDGGGFLTCAYEWGKDIYQGTVTVAGKTIEYGSPAKVMIVMAKGIQEEEYKKSTSVYKDAVDVSGIGQMAVWGGTMSQLSFLNNGILFHINVKVLADKAANKQKAISLAEIIIGKL